MDPRLGICIKLRRSGMPLAEIRRFAELVREGPGNEEQRLELLREQQRRVENQLAELQDCLQIITRKVGVYEQHVADGTAQDLYTANA
jgi:DNA-binding transcriptional MerR regulator